MLLATVVSHQGHYRTLVGQSLAPNLEFTIDSLWWSNAHPNSLWGPWPSNYHWILWAVGIHWLFRSMRNENGLCLLLFYQLIDGTAQPNSSANIPSAKKMEHLNASIHINTIPYECSFSCSLVKILHLVASNTSASSWLRVAGPNRATG